MLWRAIFIVVLAVFCGAVGLGSLMPEHAQWVKDHEASAALIQAAFSILAVGMVLVVPDMQAEAQKTAEHRRNMRLLSELVAMADALLRSAADASHNQEQAIQFRGHYHLSRWEAARDALSDFPIIVFNTSAEVRHLMNVRAIMRESIDLLVVGENGYRNGVVNPHMHFTGSLARIRMLREQVLASIENLSKLPK